MCGGGGGVQTVDPMAQARANNWQAAQDAARQRAAEALATQKENARLAAAQASLDNAYNAARNSVYNQLQSQYGVDPNQYATTVDDFLNNIRSTVPKGDANPGSYFGQPVVTNALNTIKQQGQQKASRQVDQFAPAGYEYNYWSNAADDAFLNDLLSNKFTDASNTLLRAQQRGQLNDTGYVYATKQLDTQKSAAAAKLQDIGGGVLNQYRTGLGDIVNQARTNANNLNIGDQFNLGQYQNRFNETYAQQQDRLGGDISSAVGNDALFDPLALIQMGGSRQGLVNNQGDEIAGIIAQSNADRMKKRGLDTQGVF